MAISEKVINEVFASAWEVAIHENPMLLAQHQSEAVIVRTRHLIKELLVQGCSVSETSKRVAKALLDPRSPLYREAH